MHKSMTRSKRIHSQKVSVWRYFFFDIFFFSQKSPNHDVHAYRTPPICVQQKRHQRSFTRRLSRSFNFFVRDPKISLKGCLSNARGFMHHTDVLSDAANTQTRPRQRPLTHEAPPFDFDDGLSLSLSRDDREMRMRMNTTTDERTNARTHEGTREPFFVAEITQAFSYLEVSSFLRLRCGKRSVLCSLRAFARARLKTLEIAHSLQSKRPRQRPLSRRALKSKSESNRFTVRWT